MRLLLARGASVHAVTNCGESALHFAAREAHLAVAALPRLRQLAAPRQGRVRAARRGLWPATEAGAHNDPLALQRAADLAQLPLGHAQRQGLGAAAVRGAQADGLHLMAHG